MTSHITERATYHGLQLVETRGVGIEPICVDMAIYVSGWESRAHSIANSKLIVAKRVIILSFEDDGLDDIHAIKSYISDDAKLIEMKLKSHYDIAGSISRFIEQFSNEVRVDRPLSLFIDITSLPKFFLQWMFMELMRNRVVPKISVGYVGGLYGLHDRGPSFDQGVHEYVEVPHALGDGGSSIRRGCIASLGADERLISHYFESEAGFDRYHLLGSFDEIEPTMTDVVNRQIAILSSKYSLKSEDVSRVSPFSFIESLRSFDRMISVDDKIDSWELFCSGPKPFAIAACLLALKYKNVRLMGRIPKEYSKFDVSDGGMTTILSVIDLTNPAVSQIGNIR